MNRTAFFDTFNNFTREVDHCFSKFVKTVDGTIRNKVFTGKQATGDFPHVNVYEDEQAYVIEALTPGVEPNRLDIAVQHDTLLIKGERVLRPKTGDQEPTYESFTRTVPLAENADTGRIEAEYKNGVLTVIVPKGMESTNKIHIKVG